MSKDKTIEKRKRRDLVDRGDQPSRSVIVFEGTDWPSSLEVVGCCDSKPHAPHAAGGVGFCTGRTTERTPRTVSAIPYTTRAAALEAASEIKGAVAAVFRQPESGRWVSIDLMAPPLQGRIMSRAELLRKIGE